MKTFVITEELTKSLLDYLVTKPYGEVATLVSGLAAMPGVEINEQKTEATKQKNAKRNPDS